MQRFAMCRLSLATIVLGSILCGVVVAADDTPAKDGGADDVKPAAKKNAARRKAAKSDSTQGNSTAGKKFDPLAGTSEGELDPKLKNFVALKERAAKKAHENLVNAIARREKVVRKSDMHPDLKQIALKKIGKDREEFEQLERLPNCDELLVEAIAYLDEYQVKVLGQVESTRLLKVDQAVRAKQEPAAKPGLAALEARFEKIVGGRKEFKDNSNWKGSRFFPDHAVEVHFHVTERIGNGFRGVYDQHGPGGGKMKVQGILHGNVIAIQTYEMISGKNRNLVFTGYLVNDRIIANVSGMNSDKTPAVGTISMNYVRRK